MRFTMLSLVMLVFTLFASAQSNIFNIVFQQDFEDDTPGLYNSSEWREDWNSPAYANGLDKTYIVTEPDGNKVMKWNYPKGSVSVRVSGAVSLNRPFASNPDEIYLSYNIKFRPGFDWVEGGKLPGLRGARIRMVLVNNPNGMKDFPMD